MKVIVTGSSRGLGLEIVKKILENTSYDVIGISRKKNEDIKKLEKENRYHHIVYDLSNSEKIKYLYLEKIKPLGPIYGLINNAAIAYDDIITNAKYEPLEKMFKVNIFTPILLTKYIIRDMLLNNVQGSIIHVSSVCAHTGYKGLSMYAATKGAIEAFSKTVAREFGVRKIRSNVIAPGFMETSMSSSLTDLQKDRIYKRTSLKEETRVSSVAETAVFLLSEKSYSITGQVIHVDNGTL